MREVNLLHSLPRSKRSVKDRAARTDEHIRTARLYGHDYFDGERAYGYGGYHYDGRWSSVAKDIIERYELEAGDRVLDIGCAKGFLVKALMDACVGLEAFGVDISQYALMRCEEECIGRLHWGTAIELPFPDNSFKAVTCINTLHNLERIEIIVALREIERICRTGRSFVQVDSYHTPQEKALFEQWVLTAKYHGYPHEWLEVFMEAGYTGDYYWTVIT
jgi:ubiquinone/menaquinone biosynthesis C-methylase UbiE